MPPRSVPKILVVEDDRATQGLLVSILVDDGYSVEAVTDGSHALSVARDFRPDLVLLDARLPGVDGWSVARRLRQAGDVPIIFVTGLDSPEDVRAGFDLGGDDYIRKPFDAEELSSRVRAVLRRAGQSFPEVWEIKGLVVDSGGRSVTMNGVPVVLTAIEFDLLEALVRRRGRVMPKQELLARVWGYDETDRDDHLVEVHVSSLRRKLEANGGRLIHTVRGAGYVLRPPD